jgi:hypothetical protein
MVLFAFGKTCHLRPVQSLRSAIPHALSSVSQDVGGRVEWKYEHKNALPESLVNLPLGRLGARSAASRAILDLNVFRRGSSGSTYVTQSSFRAIFSMEQFVSLKNPVWQDAQGINTGLLQTI